MNKWSFTLIVSLLWFTFWLIVDRNPIFLAISNMWIIASFLIKKDNE